MLKLTIVAPVFNEEEIIEQFYKRTRSVLNQLQDTQASILFVVDRSTDKTLDILRKIAKEDQQVQVISLSSRFGHQMSLMAGIEAAHDADAIVMIDSDLQHPPELIKTLLDKFHAGFEVVYTTRIDTKSVGLLRKKVGNLFYRFLINLSQIPIHANSADFRLISKRVSHILSNDFRERNMFLRGLFSWMGFNQIGVPYVAEARFAGHSKYSLPKMLQLAMSGIVSFSTKPLQLSIFMGIGFAALAFLMSIYCVVDYFIDKNIPSGWTTLSVLLLFFSGLQLIVLGIIGAYIGSIYEESKGRPRYIIDEVINLKL